jgi:hypothetical protein
MIPRERFIAHKEEDYEGWLAARRNGVTATQVANASTPAGFEKAVADYVLDYRETDNDYMRFGRDWEGYIAQHGLEWFNLEANEWLIAGDDPRHLATPDAIGVDAIGEYKTTGKDWGTVDKLPLKYKRQVQWQLYVTDYDVCVVMWLLRKTVDTEEGPVMVPAWFEPKTGWVERDEKMIDQLVDTANRLWIEVDGRV